MSCRGGQKAGKRHRDPTDIVSNHQRTTWTWSGSSTPIRGPACGAIVVSKRLDAAGSRTRIQRWSTRPSGTGSSRFVCTASALLPSGSSREPP
jgi:hypothetical protein